MYERLELENFKAFKALSLELRPLTLLSGMNGMGKSSVLQALLLLRQSYLQRSDRLILNGSLVELGTGADVLFQHAEKDEISIVLEFDEIGKTMWRFRYEKQSDALHRVGDAQQVSDMDIYTTSLFADRFHYLQAERLGPRVIYEMSDYEVREHRQIGTRGEYTAHFLSYWTYEDRIQVSPPMRYPNNNSSLLLDQVTAWLSEISPGTQVDIQPHSEMDIMSMRFGFRGTESFRSTNVGFGITYTLPVLVALLSSQPGALVLLENPEAHLHPRAQAQMGELIARAAASGVQVILETHSDHVFNGIRIAIRERVLEPDSAAFHFFQRNAGETVQVISPQVDTDGRFESQTPINFFDEYRKSMRRLL